MNKKISHKIFVPIVFLTSMLPTISYAYNNTNPGEAMPPPGPYRSVMNANPKPQMPEWARQQQQHNKNMQAMFEKRKADFEKRMTQYKDQATSEAPTTSFQQPRWVKEKRDAQQKHFQEMQLKHQQNRPQNYAKWEENRQKEIKKYHDEFEKRQAEAKQRAEQFRKSFATTQNTTMPQQQKPPEWVVKQQLQAQKQMEFYRAQQQKWRQQNQPRWNAQRQPRPYPNARGFSRPPQFRPMPPRYPQMNPNIPPWVNPQYQSAPWR